MNTYKTFDNESDPLITRPAQDEDQKHVHSMLDSDSIALRLRGGCNGLVGSGLAVTICCACTFLIVLCSVAFISSVSPTDYALRFNKYTGSIDYSRVYDSGLYVLGPGQSFITFPGYARTLTFSKLKGSDSQPIQCRTGMIYMYTTKLSIPCFIFLFIISA